jgi:phosphoribosylglycinamide formyltransferase-1
MEKKVPSKIYKIGILASTNGTDLQAIIDEMKAGTMPGIEIAVVLSNKKDSYALERARTNGYEAVFIDPKNFTHTLGNASDLADIEQKYRETYDLELARVLKEYNVDLVALIGYMRILTPAFVRQVPRGIINVHPALMPKFSGPGFYGSNVHQEVLKAGEKETGCTIHFVDEGVDTGEIILQKKVTIESSDTAETLKEKVQALEKKWYPEVIRWFSEGKIR